MKGGNQAKKAYPHHYFFFQHYFSKNRLDHAAAQKIKRQILSL